MASKAEEELRKLGVNLQLLEQSVDQIQSRMNVVNAIIADLAYARTTVEALSSEKENAELLVPAGGNTYVRAKLENPDRVIVGIGAGVAVEKTIGEAKDIIQRRSGDMEKTRQTLQQQFSSVADQLERGRGEFESRVAKLREGTAPLDV